MSSEQCQTLLYYTFRDADARDVKQLLVMLKNIPTYGEDIMSVAQKLEEQGERLKALAIAKKMQAKGIDINFIQEMTDLSEQELLQLEGA